MLDTFGSVPDREAVAGDLFEQYPTKSAAWYWRQVILAVVIGALQQWRQHDILTIRAITAGVVPMPITSSVGEQLAYLVVPLVLDPPISPLAWPV